MRATILLFAAVVVSSGCSRGGDAGDGACCPCPEVKGQPLAASLMSVLASARAYHHQADILLGQGDVEGAIEKVRAILKLDLNERWPEAEEVRVDATARLAKLLLRKKAHDEALKLIEGELAKALRPSFYQANLYSVRGEVLEAKVKELDAAGEKEEAKGLARQALAAFERAIAINKALQIELQKKPKAAGGKP